jgi:hypothetical protein
MSASSIPAQDDFFAAHQDLMFGYKEALAEGDQVDFLNKAFIHHVIRVSSENVLYQLVTRANDAQAMVSETKEFAAELAKRDSVTNVLSFAKDQGLPYLKVIGFSGIVGLVGGALFRIISTIAKAGNTTAQRYPGSKQMIYRLIAGVLFGGGVGVKFANDYWKKVTSLYNFRMAAHQLLAAHVDEPETRFFRLAGGSPPHRITINVIGPVGAILLTLPAIALGWFFVSVLAQ